MWHHQISCSAYVMQASMLVADWSMRWSRDTLLKKFCLYIRSNESISPKMIHSSKTWSSEIWLIHSNDDLPNIDPSLQKIIHWSLHSRFHPPKFYLFIQKVILQKLLYPKNYLFLQLKIDSFSTDVFCIFIRF